MPIMGPLFLQGSIYRVEAQREGNELSLLTQRELQVLLWTYIYQAKEAVYSDIIQCQIHKLKQTGFFIKPKEIQEELFLGKMSK
jgi:hypothetical protein